MASEQPLSEEVVEVEEASSELPVREYIALIKKRRVLIAACIGLSVAVATAMALLSTPYYRAVAVLAVEKDRGGTLGLTPGDFGYDPDFIPTQIRLMKSREIAARVVKRLKLTEHPAFQPRTPRGLFGRKIKVTPAAQSTAATPEVRVAMVAQGVRGGIDVQQVRATNVVELSYVGTSPQLAADIANAAAESYIEWNREAKFEPIGEASQFLSGQAQQIRNELDVKERQLLAYGRQKDIVSSEPGANAPLQNLESLNADYAGAVADRVAKEAKYHSLRSGRADAAADTLSFGLVSQLRADQARLEREYAEKLNVFKPEW
ncbi:MAG TPA: Wzz/FepE/Etk N-terminal domain-containing protein, partial [Thermoanaerobaculia bacterium]|nr:Wzz/FepE/Etk N-terminal domain-containing protein [Thermoanaerobaculia bacterium]